MYVQYGFLYLILARAKLTVYIQLIGITEEREKSHLIQPSESADENPLFTCNVLRERKIQHFYFLYLFNLQVISLFVDDFPEDSFGIFFG
jgi:hypothetical protein